MKKDNQLDLTNHRIWKDKNIKKEGKLIYSYIYSKCFNKIVSLINVGDIQQVIRITNIGFKKNLEQLEKHKYITFSEKYNGVYAVRLGKLNNT